MFSGPGGIGLAANLANVKLQKTGGQIRIKHLWANDFDNDSCKTYQENIDVKRMICLPVKELFKQIDSKRIKDLEKIDAFAFGFPCNDFSIVGKQKGLRGKFGPLYTYGVEAIRRYSPDWFFAENVGGIASAGSGKVFRKVLYDLRNAGKGYELTSHLYKFEEYGIPQRRHRIIIIGIKKSLGLCFKVPKPSYRTVTAKEAIESKKINGNDPNHVFTKNSPAVIERLKHTRPGENAFTASLPEELQINVKGAKLSQIYKRLDPNKPSYTVTGSGGGGTHVYHWKENRALTNRERARLQTFPDNFIFYGSKESQRKQIGMAVPVKGAKIIIESVLKTLAGIDYKSVPANIQNDLFD